jgi:hypothetical protein
VAQPGGDIYSYCSRREEHGTHAVPAVAGFVFAVSAATYYPVSHLIYSYSSLPGNATLSNLLPTLASRIKAHGLRNVHVSASLVTEFLLHATLVGEEDKELRCNRLSGREIKSSSLLSWPVPAMIITYRAA